MPSTPAKLSVCVCLAVCSLAFGPSTEGADSVAGFTPEQLHRSGAFHAKHAVLSALSLAAKAALLLGLFALRGRLRLCAGRKWYVQVAAWAVVAALVMALVNTVASALNYRWHLAAGLTHQHAGDWLVDTLKLRLRGVTLSVLYAVGVYACIGWLGRRRWWVGAFLLLATIRTGSTLLMTHRDSTLLYDFVPLQAGHLRTRIETLIAKSGHGVAAIKVARTSRISTCANAWIGLFGNERHLVLTDTLVERYSPDEIGIVVAHELGHLREAMFAKAIVLGALHCLLGLALAHVLLMQAAKRGHEPFGLPHTVPLYMLAMLAASVVWGPVRNQVRKRSEIAANRYALELTKDADAFIRLQRRITVENLSPLEVRPWVRALFMDHPTPTEAIADAERWRDARGPASSPRLEARPAEPGH